MGDEKVRCLECRRLFPPETMEFLGVAFGMEYHLCKDRDKKLRKCNTISSDVLEDPLPVVERIVGTLPNTAMTRYQRLDLHAAIDALKKRAAAAAEGDAIDRLDLESAKALIRSIYDFFYRDPETGQMDPDRPVSGTDLVDHVAGVLGDLVPTGR